MVKNINTTLPNLVSAKAFKKVGVQSVACLFIASSSVTLSSLSAFALDQNHASTRTSVDAEGLKKDGFVAKDTKNQNFVEKDGLQFETLIPEAVVKIPEKKPDARALIRFGCRITNKTERPIRIVWFLRLKPQTVTSSRITTTEAMVSWGGTSEYILPFHPNPPDYPSEEFSSKFTYPLLMPNESTTYFLDGYLFWYENKLTIELGDFNSYYILYNIKPNSAPISLDAGEYNFWFNYTNQLKKVRNSLLDTIDGIPEKELWVGSVETSVVKFRLVNAK